MMLARARPAHYILLAGMLLFAFVPLIWTISTSFKTNVDAQAYPPRIFVPPVFENYIDLLKSPGFQSALGNSILITVGTVLVAVASAFLAAYALVRLRVPMRGLLVIAVVAVQTVPGMALVVPLYLMASATGVYDTHLLIVLVYATLTMPIATWILVAFMKDMPIELEEAARIDGATRPRVLWHVIVPISRPALGSAAILVAIASWNEYLMPLFLTTSDARPLTVFMSATFVTQKAIEWGPLAAATVLVLMPIVIVVLALQRQFIAGLAAGSVKG